MNHRASPRFWSCYNGLGFSIEFVPEKTELVTYVILEIRGTGDPVSPILRLSARNNWVALDCSTSEFIDPANPTNVGSGGYLELLKDVRSLERKSSGAS